VVVCVLALVAGGTAWSGQEKPKVSVEVKLVTVFATVRDKHGKYVSNLPQEDFTLEEDGRPQTIRYFEHESNQPLTLGLLVDTSLSVQSVLGEERKASQAFLDHLLRAEKDRAFVIHFDREVEMLQDVTSSRSKLELALNLLEIVRPDFSRQGGGSSGGGGGGGGVGGGGHRYQFIGGTLLYDAVYLASSEVLQTVAGRKAMIVLTDGEDRGSRKSLEAAHGGYGGRRGGQYPRQNRPDGKKVLERIAGETGGRMFQVTKKSPIDEIYRAIGEELHNQYSLGYTPDREDPGTGFHRIHLATKDKELIVQARSGYYYRP